jgi:purine-binding chemotaxis protein CheW
MSSALTNQFLTFMLGGETYGIEITRIREILVYPAVTSLPNTQHWVKGVINLRGEVTPIIDLRVRFNTTNDPQYTGTTIIIAVKTNNGRMLGLVVDNVSDVETIDYDKLLPAPDMGSSISAEYLKGLIKKDERMVIILDTEKVLDKSELDALSKSAA